MTPATLSHTLRMLFKYRRLCPSDTKIGGGFTLSIRPQNDYLFRCRLTRDGWFGDVDTKVTGLHSGPNTAFYDREAVDILTKVQAFLLSERMMRRAGFKVTIPETYNGSRASQEIAKTSGLYWSESTVRLRSGMMLCVSHEGFFDRPSTCIEVMECHNGDEDTCHLQLWYRGVLPFQALRMLANRDDSQLADSYIPSEYSHDSESSLYTKSSTLNEAIRSLVTDQLPMKTIDCLIKEDSLL